MRTFYPTRLTEFYEPLSPEFSYSDCLYFSNTPHPRHLPLLFCCSAGCLASGSSGSAIPTPPIAARSRGRPRLRPWADAFTSICPWQTRLRSWLELGPAALPRPAPAGHRVAGASDDALRELRLLGRAIIIAAGVHPFVKPGRDTWLFRVPLRPRGALVLVLGGRTRPSQGPIPPRRPPDLIYATSMAQPGGGSPAP